MKKTYKFELPENKETKTAEVRIENGKVIVDVEFEEKFKPKDGDFCVSDNGYLFIFKNEFISSHFERCASCYYGIDADGNLDYNLNYTIEDGRYATLEEKSSFLKRLEKECSKRWNPKTKKLEDIRWKPQRGASYYYIGDYGSIFCTKNLTRVDDIRISYNNCFKTENAAKPYADQIKEIFKNSKAE